MAASLIEFLSMRDPNVRLVITGVMLFTASCASVGCFSYLRKRSLIGEAIAHSVLPGICLAFIIFQSKDFFYLIIGAALTGWLSLLSIEIISSRSRLKADASIALVLSVFFGIGILMLTAIQNSGNAAQAGLDHFLFGQAASINAADIRSFVLVALFVLLIIVLFFNSFKIMSFDEDFAGSIGVPVRFMKFLLSTLTVLTVAVSIQAVGVVLVAAMLITPAAAARYWTDNLVKMIFIAVLFAMAAGVFGAFISYEIENMPTGPWIVALVSLMAVLSLIFSPHRGLASRVIKRRLHERKVLIENILKTFYHLGEEKGEIGKTRSTEELQESRDYKPGKLQRGLNILLSKSLLLQESSNTYRLSQEGERQATRVARLHRLWELYLTRYLKIRKDHVHDDAESIEHIITPEIERLLEKELKFPRKDPHGKQINYEG